ncbi:MAG: hypothetical protein MJ085_05305 [Clostridia bacterium]|nr:hypothetical protein [Clostridia bacterium]
MKQSKKKKRKKKQLSEKSRFELKKFYVLLPTILFAICIVALVVDMNHRGELRLLHEEPSYHYETPVVPELTDTSELGTLVSADITEAELLRKIEVVSVSDCWYADYLCTNQNGGQIIVTVRETSTVDSNAYRNYLFRLDGNNELLLEEGKLQHAIEISAPDPYRIYGIVSVYQEGKTVIDEFAEELGLTAETEAASTSDKSIKLQQDPQPYRVIDGFTKHVTASLFAVCYMVCYGLAILIAYAIFVSAYNREIDFERTCYAEQLPLRYEAPDEEVKRKNRWQTFCMIASLNLMALPIAALLGLIICIMGAQALKLNIVVVIFLSCLLFVFYFLRNITKKFFHEVDLLRSEIDLIAEGSAETLGDGLIEACRIFNEHPCQCVRALCLRRYPTFNQVLNKAPKRYCCEACKVWNTADEWLDAAPKKKCSCNKPNAKWVVSRIDINWVTEHRDLFEEKKNSGDTEQ